MDDRLIIATKLMPYVLEQCKGISRLSVVDYMGVPIAEYSDNLFQHYIARHALQLADILIKEHGQP